MQRASLFFVLLVPVLIFGPSISAQLPPNVPILANPLDCNYYLSQPSDDGRDDGRSFQGYRGIDKLADPEFGGYVFRSYIPEGLSKSHLQEIATKSPLGPKLGIYYDPDTNMVTYPDVVSLKNRLKSIYLEWG